METSPQLSGQQLHTKEFHLEGDQHSLQVISGQFDENIRQIERRLGVEINNRGNQFEIIGPEDSTEAAFAVIQFLQKEFQDSHSISPADMHAALQDANVKTLSSAQAGNKEELATILIRKKKIVARGANQSRYVRNILNDDISFGIGPAGTGKTYLAVAAAVDALEQDLVRRIVLTRPAVEAGERLGFLPGDLSQKISTPICGFFN